MHFQVVCVCVCALFGGPKCGSKLPHTSSQVDAVLELSLASGLAAADARRHFFQRFGRRLGRSSPSSSAGALLLPPSDTNGSSSVGDDHHGRSSFDSSAAAEPGRQDAALRAIFAK